MQMSKKITKEILKSIGEYILDGLSEREACILADVDPADLATLKERSDQVTKFLEKTMVEFKHSHLKQIQSKKSEKNSQWLLEKLLPEEFGAKAKGSGEGINVNIIKQIITSIQNDYSGQSIVSPIRRGDTAAGRTEEAGIPVLDISSALQ